LFKLGTQTKGMGAYTIRELENLSGIKAHTIRIWEKRYGLIAPQRTSTNIRSYCDSELKKLLNISILNRNGIKISKIAQLSPDEITAKINEFTQKVTSTESQIESLTVAMIDMDEYRFEHVLARSIILFGFEEAVIRVLYPFFIRVGLMWQTGSVSPVQEHFISNLVKQKFYSAIDGLIGHENEGARHMVFFLPEGEFHEIGLLFSCYLARKHGCRTLYLGQSLPLKDLEETLHVKKVDFLFTTLISSYSGIELSDYIRMLSARFSNHIIYLSGSRVMHYQNEVPPNIRILNSPAQFLEELGRIQPVPVPAV
jgi:MerR family transcriptional regulator, light-induced transcriptional regulator